MRFVLFLFTIIGFSASANAQSDEIKLTMIRSGLFGQRAGHSWIFRCHPMESRWFSSSLRARGGTSRCLPCLIWTDKKPKMITRSPAAIPNAPPGCDFVSNSAVSPAVCSILMTRYRRNCCCRTIGRMIAPGYRWQGHLRTTGPKDGAFTVPAEGGSLTGILWTRLPESDDVLMAWNFVPEVNASRPKFQQNCGMAWVLSNSIPRQVAGKGVEKARRFAIGLSLATATETFRLLVSILSAPSARRGDSGSSIKFSYRLARRARNCFRSEQHMIFPASKRISAACNRCSSKNVGLFGLELHQGRLALFSVTLDGNRWTEELCSYAHPEVDVAGMSNGLASDGRVVGASSTQMNINRTRVFRQEHSKLRRPRQLSKAALPGNPSTLQYVGFQSG